MRHSKPGYPELLDTRDMPLHPIVHKGVYLHLSLDTGINA